jgi:hypothetical protein
MIKLKLLKPKKADRLKKPIHLTYRIIHKKNHIVWVEEFMAILFTKMEKIAFIEGIFIDITERNKPKQLLKKRTCRSSKCKIRFFSQYEPR